MTPPKLAAVYSPRDRSIRGDEWYLIDRLQTVGRIDVRFRCGWSRVTPTRSRLHRVVISARGRVWFPDHRGEDDALVALAGGLPDDAITCTRIRRDLIRCAPGSDRERIAYNIWGGPLPVWVRVYLVLAMARRYYRVSHGARRRRRPYECVDAYQAEAAQMVREMICGTVELEWVGPGTIGSDSELTPWDGQSYVRAVGVLDADATGLALTLQWPEAYAAITGGYLVARHGDHRDVSAYLGERVEGGWLATLLCPRDDYVLRRPAVVAPDGGDGWVVVVG